MLQILLSIPVLDKRTTGEPILKMIVRRYVKRQGGVEEFLYLQSIHVRIKGGCWNQNLFDSNPDIQDESSVASPRVKRVDEC